MDAESGMDESEGGTDSGSDMASPGLCGQSPAAIGRSHVEVKCHTMYARSALRSLLALFSFNVLLGAELADESVCSRCCRLRNWDSIRLTQIGNAVTFIGSVSEKKRVSSDSNQKIIHLCRNSCSELREDSFV
jgi:hypothetical protein